MFGRFFWLKFGSRQIPVSEILGKYRGVTLVNCVLSGDGDSSQECATLSYASL
jgi:hypothetical protein